jgi:MFS family permease
VAAEVESRRAWTVVGTGFVSCFTVFGVAYSFGAFFKPMAAEFGAGKGATSAVFSITAFLYFMLGLFSGRIVDRIGPRVVLLTGAVVMCAGLLLTSRVNHLWLGYITYGVGVGVGVACGYVPMVAVVGGWFVRRRTMALGITVAGIGVGTLLVSPLAGALVRAYGWRTTYVVFGIGAGALLALCSIVAERPPRHAVTSGVGVGDAIRTTAFRSLYVSGFFMSLALFVPLVFIAPYAEDHGISKVAASTLVGVLGGASIAGRLGLGGLAIRWGRVRTYRACFLVMTLSFTIWLLAVRSYPLLLLYVVVMGVGYGGFIALSPAVVADFFGLARLGSVIGALYTSSGVGGLVSAPIAGRLIDMTGGYQWAIAVAMVLAGISWSALLPLGRADRRRAGADAQIEYA